MADARLRLEELHTLIVEVLLAHDTARDNADRVAGALVAAEADGQKGHGASRVPSYAAQARSGKVDGHAVPEAIRLTDSAAIIDARDGFAYPAIALAQRTLLDRSRDPRRWRRQRSATRITPASSPITSSRWRRPGSSP